MVIKEKSGSQISRIKNKDSKAKRVANAEKPYSHHLRLKRFFGADHIPDSIGTYTENVLSQQADTDLQILNARYHLYKISESLVVPDSKIIPEDNARHLELAAYRLQAATSFADITNFEETVQRLDSRDRVRYRSLLLALTEFAFKSCRQEDPRKRTSSKLVHKYGDLLTSSIFDKDGLNMSYSKSSIEEHDDFAIALGHVWEMQLIVEEQKVQTLIPTETDYQISSSQDERKETLKPLEDTYEKVNAYIAMGMEFDIDTSFLPVSRRLDAIVKILLNSPPEQPVIEHRPNKKTNEDFFFRRKHSDRRLQLPPAPNANIMTIYRKQRKVPHNKQKPTIP